MLNINVAINPGHENAGACLLCDLLGIRLKGNSKRPVSPTEICTYLIRMLRLTHLADIVIVISH